MRWTISLLLVLLVQGPALAHPDRGGQPGPPSGLDLRGLSLSTEQRALIRELREADRQALAEIKTGLEAEQRQLQKLLASDATDNQLRQQFERVDGLRRQIARLRFDNLLKTRAILSTEQRARLANDLERVR
ncbi:MAG: periplasmic heavy metal sensor [Gemmatimonadaceae bacterium]|nr:periplasmic heavy metal sensor [Gloeobacterales cyanobacterium ES-bin-141]